MLHMRGQQGGAKSNFKETMKRRTPGWYSIRQAVIQKSVGHLQRYGCHAASSPLYASTNSRSVDELWKRKCYPIHALSERLAKPLRDNLLGFHAFTGCDTTSAFSGHGKQSCWKTSQNHPHFVQGIGRDGELAPIEQCVCHLYGTPEQQPSTMPDSNSSVRASLVWRCYPQPETPWNFTPHAPTIKQRFGCRQTRSI